MNYERDIRIDVTALDVEWTEQAELAMKYGRLWADAKEELERAQEDIKLIKAELNAKVNSDPEKYLGEGVKATVANVEAYVLRSKKYKEAWERSMEASKQETLLSIAKNEISFTRKAALENLVVLHGQQYFAGPKMPRDIYSEVTRARQAKELQKTKLNRRMRINKKEEE